MIVVRDIFRVKFGHAREVTALWKQAVELLVQGGFGVRGARLLTDLAGQPYYTIVVESMYDSVAQWEQAHNAAKTNARWREVYQQIIPLTEKGRREIFSVVE
jgi:heme-degrading monooxygenase HmoA